MCVLCVVRSLPPPHLQNVLCKYPNVWQMDLNICTHNVCSLNLCSFGAVKAAAAAVVLGRGAPPHLAVKPANVGTTPAHKDFVCINIPHMYMCCITLAAATSYVEYKFTFESFATHSIQTQL